MDNAGENASFRRFLKSSKRKHSNLMEEIEEDGIFFPSASSSIEEEVVAISAQVVAELQEKKDTYVSFT